MTSSAARTYDAGASAYDRLTGRWSRLYVPSLLSAAGVARGHSVLDVAAGTGGASVELAVQVGATGRVLAVDLSLPMLRVAAGKVAGLPVQAAIMDGQQLACRARAFDAVVCQLGRMLFQSHCAASRNSGEPCARGAGSRCRCGRGRTAYPSTGCWPMP